MQNGGVFHIASMRALEPIGTAYRHSAIVRVGLSTFWLFR
jgi:hypothetical protein